MYVHASAVAFDGKGVLIKGASGSGKSSLALDLMSRGATLISDDQTELWRQNDSLWARPPDSLAGLIEARGIGILNADWKPAPIVAVVDLDHVETERLPKSESIDFIGIDLPLLRKIAHPTWNAALAQYLRFGRNVSK